jgi:dipeptidase
VSVCPNESRIGEIDINDEDNFMFSENVVSFAIDMGLYDPDSGEPFSWKHAYSPGNYSAASSGGSRGRMWRFYDLVAPSKKFSPDTPNMDFPVTIKPDKKYSVDEVIDMLRDNFEGTPYDCARGLQGGAFQNPNHLPYGFTLDGKRYNTPRSIGMNRSEYTTVIQVRDWLPNPIGGIVWISFGSQNTNCFMPFYQGVTRVPESFMYGDHWKFDRGVARWAFDYVDFHSYVMYSYAIQDVRAAQKKWELGAIQRTEEIDKKALALYNESPEKAVEYLNDYCNNNADLVVNAWWKLGDDLLVKYNHLWIYDVKERQRNRPDYPEWWLRELIEYNDLKPAVESEH